MFSKNVGGVDRILRIVIGIALLVAFAMTGSYWFLIGIVPLATGLMSSCPLYSILGFRTCPMSKS